MIDQSKVTALREAAEEVAAEYERSGVPDVAKKLRELASVPPHSLARLYDILQRTTNKSEIVAELQRDPS
jgi:hypothetical protein